MRMAQLLGGCLLAAGILIAGASGLCTLLMVSYGDWGDLIIGLLPLAIGLGLVFAGRRLISSGARGYRS
jgi:hypothetical protein